MRNKNEFLVRVCIIVYGTELLSIFNVQTRMHCIYFLCRDPCWQMRVNENNGKGVAGHTNNLAYKSILESGSIQM